MNGVLIAAAVVLMAHRFRPVLRRPPVESTSTRRADAGADTLAFLETASRELRAGSSHGIAVEEGLAAAGPGAPRLRRALRSAPTDPVTAIAVAAVHRSVHLGHQPARVFDRAASTLRERLALLAEQRAHAAQARLSARVLTVVPVVFAGLTAWGSPSVRSVLASPFGMAVAVTGLALNGLGWWWMRRIIGRSAA